MCLSSGQHTPQVGHSHLNSHQIISGCQESNAAPPGASWGAEIPTNGGILRRVRVELVQCDEPDSIRSLNLSQVGVDATQAHERDPLALAVAQLARNGEARLI